MDDALDMQDKANAVEIALGKAWGFATALHGQVNGLVKNPIDLTDRMAAVERTLSFLAEADEIVGDVSAEADVLCHSAGCTARLIENWLQNADEGGHQLDAHAMDMLVWDLVNKIDAARTALPAPVTPAKEGRCHA